MEFYLYFLFDNGQEESFRDLAILLTNNSNDPELITRTLIDYMVPKPLHTPEDYTVATDIFKWDIPQNYYDEGTWNLTWSTVPLQCILLLIHIVRMPEFQFK